MITLLLLAGCSPTASDVVEDPVWAAFTEQRDARLAELSVPIEACVGEVDTDHPAFHGCIDWHSHVHATFSLLAIGRMTGDPHYAEVADETLVADDLAAELEAVTTTGVLPSEIPYGYAWFLVLARERERQGRDDLAPIADVAADDLETWVDELSDARLAGTHRSDDYTNLSWALLNLYLWAEHTGDTARLQWIEDLVRERILPLEECGLETTAERTRDFFPPCLHRARLLLAVLPEDEARAWRDTAVPDGFSVDPVVPDSAHTAGLSWSRSWGVYDLWRATGDPGLRDDYIDLFETHYAMPEYWAEDYQAHSHWVAQFGVYSLALDDGIP